MLCLYDIILCYIILFYFIVMLYSIIYPTHCSSGAVEKELAPLIIADVMITSWAKNRYTKGAWSYVPGELLC